VIIDKKKFLAVLSQIKARKDVVVLKDSHIDGYLDILYSPPLNETPYCFNKMTISIGVENDIFDDSPVEKLGEPVPFFLSRLKGIVKNAKDCVLKDGCLNGIRASVDEFDINYPELAWIMESHKKYSKEISGTADFESFSLQRADYSYMVSECAKFVSNDPFKRYLLGICFDFAGGGKDFINAAASNGQAECVFKWGSAHKEYDSGKGQGRFIIRPEYLHIPGSEYGSAKISLSNNMGRLTISTDDYSFEGIFRCEDETFPNYLGVIPKITDETQWLELCPASLRRALDLGRSFFGSKEPISLNAENPESLYITVGENQQALEIDGRASRPMILSCKQDNLLNCLFDGEALTRFWLNGSTCTIVSRELKAEKGLTFDVTKVFAPRTIVNENCDKFNIPLPKRESGEEPGNENAEAGTDKAEEYF
jgi:hypothetical protein